MPSLGKYPAKDITQTSQTLLTDTTHTIYYRGHWLRVRTWSYY